MRYSIGDSVRVVNEARLSNGRLGTITKPWIEHYGYDWVVTLDSVKGEGYTRTLAYLEKEIEIDKSTIINQILNEI